MKRHWYFSFFVVLATCATALAAPDCINGRGQSNRTLWDGYTLQVGPADSGHVNECHAALSGPDGKLVYELFGVDVGIDQMTGRDVSNDGNKDVVLESHTASSSDNLYSVVGTNPPGLIRQIMTGATLSFEDRGGGKIEIVTHDTAFQNGFEGVAPEDAPAPPVFLRLRGKELYNVSNVYWPEYEIEVTRAKAQLGRYDISDFMGTTPSNKTENEKGAGPSPMEQRKNYTTKTLILKVVVNYLYGGKGQEAWQALKEMWPYADRQRVQQAILTTRMKGVLSDSNRTTPRPAPVQASPAAPPPSS
jgi:hypothetical protein